MLNIEFVKFVCRRAIEGSIEKQEEARSEGSPEIRGATTWHRWWLN